MHPTTAERYPASRLPAAHARLREFLLLLFSGTVASCGLGTGLVVDGLSTSSEPADPAFVLTSTSPAAFSQNVSPGATIVAGFTFSVDQSSVDGATFQVTDPFGDTVPGSFLTPSVDTEFRFQPTKRLRLLGNYTANVTADVKDTKGRSLGSNSPWTFRVADGSWSQPEFVDPRAMAQLRIQGDSVVGLLTVTIGTDPCGDLVTFSTIPFDFDTGWGNLAEVPNVMACKGSARDRRDRFDLGFGPAGDLVLAYQNSSSEQYATVLAGTVGSMWTLPFLLGTSGSGRPQVFFERDGSPNVIYQVTNQIFNVSIFGRRYDGSRWESPETIKINTAEAADQLGGATDGQGRFLYGWVEGRERIYVNQFLPDTRWQQQGLVHEVVTGTVGDAGLAVGRGGQASIVWVRNFPDDADRIEDCRSDDFGKPSGWLLHSVDQAVSFPTYTDLQATIGPDGTALAAWQSCPDFPPGSACQTHLNTFTPGASWGSAIRMDDSQNSLIDSVLAADELGNAIVVWSVGTPDPKEIWWRRFDPEGGWSAGERLAVRMDSPTDLEVVFDPVGRGLVTWTETDMTDTKGCFSLRFE